MTFQASFLLSKLCNSSILINTYSNLNYSAGDTIMISNYMNTLMKNNNKVMLLSKYAIGLTFIRNLEYKNYNIIIKKNNEEIIQEIDNQAPKNKFIFIRNHEILDNLKDKPYLSKTILYGLDIHLESIKKLDNKFLCLITQSEKLKELYINNKILGNKIVIIEPFAYKYNFNLPERNDNEIRLIYCGTLRDEENIIEIIEEFKKIHQERPEALLKIVYGKIHGNQEFTQKVNMYIKEGVKGITFKHNLSHRDACYEIATSDIGICWRKNGWGDNGEISTKVKEYEMYGLEIESYFSFEKRLCVYTDLGLSTIDGSTMFIMDLLKMLTNFDTSNKRYIITLYHKHNLSTLYLNYKYMCNSVIKYKLETQNKSKLILLHNIDYIFIRCWQKSDTWLIDQSLKDKCLSYLPLSNNLENSILTKNYIYQTEKQLEYYKDNLNLILHPSSYCVRINPGGYLKDVIKKKSVESSIMYVNYIGTLREECCSNDMLSIMYEELSKNKNIFFYLIIGHIHINIKKDLIKKLEKLENCFVGYKLNKDEIKKIYTKSHVTLSLWKTDNIINQYLLSSKMIMGYLHNNIIIYLKPNYISDKEINVSFGLNDIYELSSKLIHIYNILQKTKYIKYSREIVTKYSYDMNIASLKKLIKSPCDFSFVHLFNNSFDYIYGLYIDKHEYERLQKIKNIYNIDINMFEGVNGIKLLQTEYQQYKNQPLKTEWEINNKKKRLSIGAMGHLYSFINMIKDAKKNDYNRILILESDIFPHKNLFEKFIEIIDIIEKYKILYLGAGMWNKDIAFKKGYYIPNQTTGTFAISFDKSIYDELISLWEKMINPTDICLWELTNKYYNECYVLYPNLFICDLTETKIQETNNRDHLYEKFNWNLYNYIVN